MTPIKVSVFGAPGSGLEQFLVGLERALETSGWPARVRMGDLIHALNKPVASNQILLMGLESNGLAGQRDADHGIRSALNRLGSSYDVLYGTAEERLAQALALIENRLGNATGLAPARPAHGYKPWMWACEKCSDPQCEHRLLTDLLASRLTAAL